MTRLDYELLLPEPGYTDYQFLQWLRNRLIWVYRHDPNDPVVTRLSRIASQIKEETRGV